MADLDDIKDGKDFRTDQPQKNIPFTLKGCGGEHDQRGLRGAGHQDAGFRRGRAARAHQAQQHAGDHGLQRQYADDRAGDGPDVLPDHGEIDAHAHGDQEHVQREALERFHDPFDLGVVLGLGDQQAGQQRANDGRQADHGGWRLCAKAYF